MTYLIALSFASLQWKQNRGIKWLATCPRPYRPTGLGRPGRQIPSPLLLREVLHCLSPSTRARAPGPPGALTWCLHLPLSRGSQTRHQWPWSGEVGDRNLAWCRSLRQLPSDRQVWGGEEERGVEGRGRERKREEGRQAEGPGKLDSSSEPF